MRDGLLVCASVASGLVYGVWVTLLLSWYVSVRPVSRSNNHG